MRLLVLAPLLLLASCSKPYDDSEEVKTREVFAKARMLEADAGRAWGLSSKSDAQFEQGFSQIQYDPPEDFRNHAFRWMGQNAHIRLKRHGSKPMRLLMVGWVNEHAMRTKPILTAYIDGVPIKALPPITDHYWLEVVIPPEQLTREWVDLNVRLSSVSWHWADPPNLLVALLYRFEWGEAP